MGHVFLQYSLGVTKSTGWYWKGHSNRLSISLTKRIHFVTATVFTARKQSLRRLCFHRCLSVHRGVSSPLHAGIHTHTPGQTPPGQTPLGQTPSPAQCMLGYTPTQCMLGYTPQKCMLEYGQQAGGMHPTWIHSCSLMWWMSHILPFTSHWILGTSLYPFGWGLSSNSRVS